MSWFWQRPPRKLKVEFLDLDGHIHEGCDPTLWPGDALEISDKRTGVPILKITLTHETLLRVEQLQPHVSMSDEVIDWAARQRLNRGSA